jgi:hypothetical protein
MEINDDVYRDLLGICLTAPKKLPYILTKVPVDNVPRGIYNTIYPLPAELPQRAGFVIYVSRDFV